MAPASKGALLNIHYYYYYYYYYNDLLQGSMCRSSMRLSNMLDVHTAALKGKRIREKSPHGFHIDYIREDSDGDDTINEGFQLDTDEGVVLDNNFL